VFQQNTRISSREILKYVQIEVDNLNVHLRPYEYNQYRTGEFPESSDTVPEIIVT